MRVLTFNSHQPYIHLLATALDWEIGVITPDLPSGGRAAWDARIRPLPENLRLYPSVSSALADRSWDWVLTHNVNDLMDCRGVTLPIVFLVHGTLSGRILQDQSSIDRNSYLRNLGMLLESHRCVVVYISPLKREDWALPGEVILPGIDTSLYGEYRGDTRAVLRVCNNMRERGRMLGFETHREICLGLPTLVLGVNRGMAESRLATNWNDLKDQYCRNRVYLNTPVYPYEDGYNLAMLEAMASGMPVAAVAHPTSPIEHGVDGVVGCSAKELREHIVRLLDNPGESQRLGVAAKRKVQEMFPISAFRSAWDALASSLRGNRRGNQKR